MKKWRLILIEAVVLIALVIAACVICSELTKEPAAPAMATDPVVTEPTETEPPATEPPPEPVVPTWVVLGEDYTLTCRDYFVYDVTAGQFLDSSGDPAETQIYPASITKLFTTYVALQYLDPQTQVTVGAEITMIDPDSTTAQLQQGDVVTVQQLVGGMLLPSGNDAAYAMAAAAGRVIKGDPNCSAVTAVSAFVEEMNKQAAALGMTGSHFCNPDGIHQDDHYTTIQDLTVLTKLALENSTIRKYALVSRASVPLESGRELQWKNTNALIDPNSDYYCNCAIGLKTGSIPQVGSCLLSAFEYNGRTMIVGVFGCASDEDRFMDTLHLFNEAMGFTDTM